MSKITVSQTENKDITLGRLVISLDEEYIIITNKRYDLNEDEYNQIKTIIESKITLRDDYISKDIKLYENLKDKKKEEELIPKE